jgi:putative endonuclease
MRARQYFVYILASRTRRLYVGCTNDLARRLSQHRAGVFRGHTARYRIHRLVYFEVTTDAQAAVARARQLKGWTRERKMRLVEEANAGWVDLAPP